MGGATNRGIHGGVSKQQSGVQKGTIFILEISVTVLNLKPTGDLNLGHTRTRNYTRGGTTSESHDKEEDKFRINARGDKVDVTPKPLF